MNEKEEKINSDPIINISNKSNTKQTSFIRDKNNSNNQNL